MTEAKEKTLSDYLTAAVFFLIGLFSIHTAFRYAFGLTQSISSLLDEKFHPSHDSSPIAKLGGAIFGDVAGWLVFLASIASIIFATFWVFVFAMRLGFGKKKAGIIVLVFYAAMALPSLMEWHKENHRAPEAVKEKQESKEQQMANIEVEQYILFERKGRGKMIISNVSSNESSEINVDFEGLNAAERISTGLYARTTRNKITNIQKSGNQSLLVSLEFMLGQMEFDKESKDLLYTNGYSLIDKKDNSVFYCFFGGSVPCLESGSKWIVEAESGCDCTKYSVNRLSVDPSFFENGIVCKKAATQECKSKEYSQLEFVENGVSFKVHKRMLPG